MNQDTIAKLKKAVKLNSIDRVELVDLLLVLEKKKDTTINDVVMTEENKDYINTIIGYEIDSLFYVNESNDPTTWSANDRYILKIYEKILKTIRQSNEKANDNKTT